jgi:hypothetical protein
LELFVQVNDNIGEQRFEVEYIDGDDKHWHASHFNMCSLESMYWHGYKSAVMVVKSWK